MTYAIIGAGNVGKALAKAFVRKGLRVSLASRRSPEELAPVAKAIGPQVEALSLQDALRADVIVLAVPFKTYKEIANAAGSWRGKVVIDATNAFGVPPEELGNDASSAGIAEALPGAGLVKAFNDLPAEILEEDPNIEGDRRVLFLASNDEDAATKVAELVHRLGFAPVSLGGLAEGGLLIQARGNSWAPLIFQDLFKKRRITMYDHVIWPEQYDPKISAIYALNDIEVKAPAEVVWKLLVDAKNWASYFPDENKVELPSGATELEPGMTYKRETIGFVMHPVITEYVPGRRLSWSTTVDGDQTDSSAYHGWVITPTAEGCHVLSEETQQGDFFLEQLGHKNPGGLFRYHQDWVEKLAKAAEEIAAGAAS